MEGQQKGITVEVALQYTDDFHSNLLTFTNNIHTYEGGTHESGFKTALTRVINDYARKSGQLKENEPNLSGEDVREGLTAVVSVKHLILSLKGKLRLNWVTPMLERRQIRHFPKHSASSCWKIQMWHAGSWKRDVGC